MRMSGSAVELSASDLSGSLSCTHLTALDLAVAKGLRKPSTWVDPSVIALRERGLDHERRGCDPFAPLRGRDLAVALRIKPEATV